MVPQCWTLDIRVTLVEEHIKTASMTTDASTASDSSFFAFIIYGSSHARPEPFCCCNRHDLFCTAKNRKGIYVKSYFAIVPWEWVLAINMLCMVVVEDTPMPGEILRRCRF